MKIRDERHGEVRSIDDMVNMVIFVRRLGDGIFDRFYRRVRNGHTDIMIDQIMAPVTDRAGGLLSDCYFRVS